jgi:hypothetical protein
MPRDVVDRLEGDKASDAPCWLSISTCVFSSTKGWRQIEVAVEGVQRPRSTIAAYPPVQDVRCEYRRRRPTVGFYLRGHSLVPVLELAGDSPSSLHGVGFC